MEQITHGMQCSLPHKHGVCAAHALTLNASWYFSTRYATTQCWREWEENFVNILRQHLFIGSCSSLCTWEGTPVGEMLGDLRGRRGRG